MRIYIVRHGQSTSNALGNHQGGNAKLTLFGKEQAKKIAARAARLQFETIISSDFSRSVQTAEIIRKRMPKKLVITPLLREEKHPSELTEQHRSDPNVLRIKKALFKHRNQQGWHFSDEENFFDLKKRAGRCIKFLEKRKEKGILVIGHVMITRMLIGMIMFGNNFTPDLFYQMREKLVLHNTGIIVCDFIEGQWKLVTWNDHAHLG